jgi:licD3 protein
MQEKISIIVPVYNVENYLERCVESILKQTYTNFELLLINDGSTDQSGELCDQLVSKNGNIKVFHLKNAGVSNARNVGIQNSTGEWITFVDSDDFITNDYLETLISAVDGDDSIGFSIARLHHIKNGQITELPVFSGKEEKWSTEQTMRELLTTSKTSFFPVAKLFRREIISDFTFNTDYHLAEDALFLTEVLLKTKCTSIFIDKPIYYYDHRQGSATTSVNTHVFDTIEVYKIIVSEVFQIFPQLKTELVNRECWSYITVYDKIIFTDSTEYQDEKTQLRKWILSHTSQILSDPYFTSFRKIAILSLRISPWIYRQIVGLNK